MLTELRITNFALIDRLSLQFSSGFHVLTGETGAGKSIIVDALALLVGSRATADHIRAEADEASIEAAFSLSPSSPLLGTLREEGVLGAADLELVVRRVLSRTGRHRIYMNGVISPLQSLQRLAGTLVDIHGQHDQQSLLSSAAQVDALDAFGKLRPVREEYTRHFARWSALRKQLEDEERRCEERQAREDLLRFQCRELEEAALEPGEDERLAAERQRLAHAERLSALLEEAYGLLYEQDAAALTMIKRAANCVKSVAEIDTEAADLPVLCETTAVQLRELVHRLRDYQANVEHDPARLADVDERLDRLQRLKKKYGLTLEGLVAKRQALAAEVEAIGSSEARLSSLRREVAEALDRVTVVGRQLSDGRRRAASLFERRVKKELAALRMEHIEFVVDLQPIGEAVPSPNGCERAEFLLSANPGQPVMPLAKVASGGELSRMMLALKTVLAETDAVPVLIFDEVDAGVGGMVATAMGERLRALGRLHQVLCITHLPQIASQADTHWLVEKRADKKRTVTRVSCLDDSSRREEVARMVGGLTVTPAVRKAAAEMMGHGRS